MRLTLLHFEIVEAVARFRSIGRAAGALGMSQPSMSRALQGLESEVGATLFERSGGGLAPTPAARVFLRRASRLQVASSRIVDEIKGLKNRSDGKLAVSNGVTAFETVFDVALAQLLGNHPRLAIDVPVMADDEVPAAVLAGVIDLGIVSADRVVNQPVLDVEPLATHQLDFFCRRGHPLTLLKRVQIEAIARYPYAGSDWIPGFPENVLADADEFALGRVDENGLVPRIRVQRFATVLSVVQASNAVGLVSRAPAQQEAFDAMFVRLNQPGFPWLKKPIALISLKNRPLSPAMQAFREVVRAVLAVNGTPAADSPSGATVKKRRKPAAAPVSFVDNRMS